MLRRTDPTYLLFHLSLRTSRSLSEAKFLVTMGHSRAGRSLGSASQASTSSHTRSDQDRICSVSPRTMPHNRKNARKAHLGRSGQHTSAELSATRAYFIDDVAQPQQRTPLIRALNLSLPLGFCRNGSKSIRTQPPTRQPWLSVDSDLQAEHFYFQSASQSKAGSNNSAHYPGSVPAHLQQYTLGIALGMQLVPRVIIRNS